MKKLFGFLIGLIVVAVIAILVGPGFVDWNTYKPEITAAVEEKTGRKLAVDGAIELQILPSPRLSVAGVRLANLAGSTDSDMISLESLQVHVALGPLMSGEVKISSVTLIRPVISLERRADGGANWDFPNPTSASTSGEEGINSSSDASSNVDIRLDGAKIIDGSVIYRDAVSGEIHRIEDLDATIAATSLSGPFSAVGGLAYQGLKTRFDVSLGQIDAGRAASLKLALAVPDIAGDISFEGTVDVDAGPSLKGKVAAKVGDLSAAASVVGAALGVSSDLPPVLAKPFNLAATVSGDPARFEISDLAIALADARVQGAISGDLSAEPSIDVALTLGRLDLDKFGLLDGRSTQTPAAVAEQGATSAASEGGGFTLPQGVRVKLAFAADALDYGGRTVRQIRLESLLDQGAIVVNILTAQLPGGTNATVSGTVYADGGLPRFVGRADVVSDNLRTALTWLEVPLNGLAPDRLRKGVFGADVDASPKQIELSNWAVDVDSTRINGGLSLVLRDRPAFGLSLVVDKLNLDAYLPTAAPGGSKTSEAAQSSSQGAPTRDVGAEITELLASFDANLLIKISEARYRNTVIRGAALDATVQAGEITIRDLSVTDIAGAGINVTGKLAGTIAAPSTDIDVSVSAKSAASLARLAGLEVTDTIQKLGGFRMKSKVLGSPASLTVDAVLDIVDGRLEARGVVRPLASPVGLDIALKLSHPRAEALLALFGGGGSKEQLKLGAGTVTASILTTPDNSIDLDATVNVAASRISVKGLLKAFAERPEVQARVAMDHPDIVELIRLGAPTFKPARRDLGPLALSFDVVGDVEALTFSGLSVQAGPAKLSGNGGARLDSNRPKVTIALTSDTIAIDPWLAADTPKPKGAVVAVPTSSGGREWSRDRIDLGVLRSFDADLDIKARKVTYSSYVVDGFALEAALARGRLTVSRIGGGLFGGRIMGSGRLDAIDVPAAEMALKIDNADIRAAALAVANKGQVSGILDYETGLSTRGASEYDMVSALNGTGKIRVRDGSVEGIDLPAVSDQLKQLDGALDFLKLAQRAMNGGATPIDELTGTYTITDGTLRSDDIALKSKTATGKTTLAVNFPVQELDATSRFWLAEHSNSPPIGVRHVGPLANPRTVLDIEKLQAYVLQRVVQRGILRQFGGKKPQAAPTVPVTEGEAAKPEVAPAPSLEDLKPRDALKGILKGLLK